MAAMAASKKYPKTLSAPVDDDTWQWFNDQAEAEDRTPGAHLRRLILSHRREVEKAEGLGAEFLKAVHRNLEGVIPVEHPAQGSTVYTAPHDPNVSVTWPPPSEPVDPDDEGMT